VRNIFFSCAPYLEGFLLLCFQFLLEDARGSSTTATANDTQTSYTRRGSASTRPSVLENNVDSSVTVALRRPAAKIIPPAPVEDKGRTSLFTSAYLLLD
jgi:hypothetical protein